MKEHFIKKGLNLPITLETIDESIETFIPKTLGLSLDDYKLFRPRTLINENSNVTPTDFIIYNKQNDKIKLNLPVIGKLSKIERGEKRKILSTFIDVNEPKFEFEFKNITEDVIETLLNSGLFTAFRMRPFDMIPDPNNLPDLIFINAMDTRPLSYEVNTILKLIEEDFICGLEIISKIANKKVFICTDTNFNLNVNENDKIEIHKFSGLHPAGLVGTHIHYISPVNDKKHVWYIDFQEVAAIGKLFNKKMLSGFRYVAISDIINKKIKVIKCPIGSNIFEILDKEPNNKYRIISGNLFYGRTVTEQEPFLGRYDYQITILDEMTERKFMEWALPGKNVFSVKNVFLSKILGNKNINFDTSMHGSLRPIIPVGAYEKVFPFDIEITHLLRYLSIRDTEMSQKLGCLELGEEDLALCTFACPGKNDYTKMLREVLDTIYYDSF